MQYFTGDFLNYFRKFEDRIEFDENGCVTESENSFKFTELTNEICDKINNKIRINDSILIGGELVDYSIINKIKCNNIIILKDLKNDCVLTAYNYAYKNISYMRYPFVVSNNLCEDNKNLLISYDAIDLNNDSNFINIYCTQYDPISNLMKYSKKDDKNHYCVSYDLHEDIVSLEDILDTLGYENRFESIKAY